MQAYLARIAAYDRAGPRLNAVRELNPDAPAIAAQSDAREAGNRRPLEGIPILVKDNIATADAQHTTAGSLALEKAGAKDDATVVKLLRQAGAVILGKTNLTEFANILAIDMPAVTAHWAVRSRTPTLRNSTTRACRLSRPAGRARDRPSPWRPGCRLRRSAPKPRDRCCRRRARTAL